MKTWLTFWYLFLCIVLSNAQEITNHPRGEESGGVLIGSKSQKNSLKRLALVIGNANYGNTLSNLCTTKNNCPPHNDAEDMAAVLEDFNYTVLKPKLDLRHNNLQTTWSAFFDKAKKENYNSLLFYYAGHAGQQNGNNILFGVDNKPIPLMDLFQKIETFGQYKEVVIILDACRSDVNISESDLKSFSTKPENVKILYATSNGRTTENIGENQRNGRYTEQLLKAIKSSPKSLNDIHESIVKHVYKFSIPGYEKSGGAFYFDQKLTPYQDSISNYYGYLDYGKEMVVPAKFSWAGKFILDKAMIIDSTKAHFINNRLELTPIIWKEELDFLKNESYVLKIEKEKFLFIDIENNSVKVFNCKDLKVFSNSLFAFKNHNDMWGLVDKKGEVVREADAYKFEYYDNLPNILYIKGKNEVVLDSTGQIIFEQNKEENENHSDLSVLSNNLVALKRFILKNNDNYETITVVKNLNHTSKFEMKNVDIQPFSNGLAIISDQSIENYKEGILDLNGQIVVEPKYKRIYNLGNFFILEDDYGSPKEIYFPKTKRRYKNKVLSYNYTKGVTNQIIVKNLEGLEGVLDHKGSVIIPFRFSSIYNYPENEKYYQVETPDNKYGIISNTGKIILEPKYDNIDLDEDITFAEFEGQYGLVNTKTGELITSFEFSNAYDFREGLAVVQKNKKYGAIDKSGNTIISFNYTTMESFLDGKSVVALRRYPEHYQVIDKNANIIYNDLKKNELKYISDDVVSYRESSLNSWGIMLIDGSIKCKDKYKNAVWFEGNRGFAKFENENYGMINKDCEIILEPKFKDIRRVKDYLHDEDYFEAIDHSGKIALFSPELDQLTDFEFYDIDLVNRNLVVDKKGTLHGLFNLNKKNWVVDHSGTFNKYHILKQINYESIISYWTRNKHNVQRIYEIKMKDSKIVFNDEAKVYFALSFNLEHKWIKRRNF